MRQTSIEARIKSIPTAAKHKKKIANTLKDKKRGTASQIAKWSGISYHAVCRRMSELVSDNIVKGQEKIHCPIKCKNVTLWEII